MPLFFILKVGELDDLLIIYLYLGSYNVVDVVQQGHYLHVIIIMLSTSFCNHQSRTYQIHILPFHHEFLNLRHLPLKIILQHLIGLFGALYEIDLFMVNLGSGFVIGIENVNLSFYAKFFIRMGSWEANTRTFGLYLGDEIDLKFHCRLLDHYCCGSQLHKVSTAKNGRFLIDVCVSYSRNQFNN